ncbi:MAG: Gfo/Idh/MocA family oxidoreductase, partial [Planctomycetales bacterium]
RLQVDKAFADYRKMLDEVKPDVISVAPRWMDQHRDMVLAAAERGIHVYLEKPMCQSLAEADEMVAACERSHVKLVIAHQTRFSPMIPVLREMIQSGKLGAILEFRARGKEDHRGGGEDLWVLGTHVMDLIRLFGGHPQWCFGSVTQKGRPVQPGDVAEGNEGLGPLAGDAVQAMYRLPDGATAYFASTRNARAKQSRFGLTIHGSAGALELHTGYLPAVRYLPHGGWGTSRGEKNWIGVSSAGIGKPEPLTDGGLHAGNLLGVKELLSSIEEQREPNGGVRDALGAAEMILAVLESHRQNAPVSLPLKNRVHPLAVLSGAAKATDAP